MPAKIIPEYVRNWFNFLSVGEEVDELKINLETLSDKVHSLTEKVEELSNKVEKIDQEYVKSEDVKIIKVLEEGQHEALKQLYQISEKTFYLSIPKQGKTDKI